MLNLWCLNQTDPIWKVFEKSAQIQQNQLDPWLQKRGSETRIWVGGAGCDPAQLSCWDTLTKQRLSLLCPVPLCCSYLLVVLHIVAQTDQTGLELLGHQRPAVVLRSANRPTTEHRVMRMNQSQHRDGGGGWRPCGPRHARRRWRHRGRTHRQIGRQTNIDGCLDNADAQQTFMMDPATSCTHQLRMRPFSKTSTCLWLRQHIWGNFSKCGEELIMQYVKILI